MYTQNSSAFMPDEDCLNTVLCDLKRTVREYATAATESSCPSVRRTFNDLTMETLRLQGDLYMKMQQMNMYEAPGKALRQDVDKQIQNAHQTQQKSQQFVSQKTGQGYGASHQASRSQAEMFGNVQPHSPNYM